MMPGCGGGRLLATCAGGQVAAPTVLERSLGRSSDHFMEAMAANTRQFLVPKNRTLQRSRLAASAARTHAVGGRGRAFPR
eukprot:COSAG01_NODE_29027_length_647_cov_0.974453_1_plen_79_part_10